MASRLRVTVSADGGFGGSIVVLTDAAGVDALAGGIVGAYGKRTGREGRFLVCESVDGAAA
jgi:galactokinase